LRLLVTGADGFTGRHFTAMARARGHVVRELRADLLDTMALRGEVAEMQPQGVVHLAAISFVDHADPDAFYRVNVLGTVNLLDALNALSLKPEKVLLASSANVYGNCVNSPISERQCPAPVNHYAASKLAMEHLASTRVSELPVFFTRPFNYTGPDQSLSFIIPKLTDHFFSRQPLIELGNLAVEREFNDVRFVCDVYLRLMERATPGQIYNVCTGRTFTLKQILDMLTELTGHKMEVKINPKFVRKSEISLLCGDPRKMTECIGQPLHIELRDTLTWMLQGSDHRQ
jgi:nucleoside-diphosphate-sugar epimerase